MAKMLNLRLEDRSSQPNGSQWIMSFLYTVHGNSSQICLTFLLNTPLKKTKYIPLGTNIHLRKDTACSESSFGIIKTFIIMV